MYISDSTNEVQPKKEQQVWRPNVRVMKKLGILRPEFVSQKQHLGNVIDHKTTDDTITVYFFRSKLFQISL
jgi:hypothetical protein